MDHKTKSRTMSINCSKKSKKPALRLVKPQELDKKRPDRNDSKLCQFFDQYLDALDRDIKQIMSL